ncbi:MAG: cytochrome c maturation protein CcmE [Marinovum sp.]|nr:cytochrome c maturation protein CcmE [Marinovum sp.]MBT4872692.1 cytochrome c maturation protein CcmE [Marinovum sp.]MBT6532218.1 cytochrome c maturation protein CcmE [Marinovum sp.]MBT7907923.1 cytochrome c maturation protein CcmE [Marinovum sp.]
MTNLKKRRRIQFVILAFIALGLSVALIGYGLRDGINYFRSPSQVLENPPDPSEVFRIGGLVEEGSIIRGGGKGVQFIVTDTNARVLVEYSGILPDLFAENQGMIGTGKYINNIFQASEILAKHDESYMPKEVVEILKEQGVFQPSGE